MFIPGDATWNCSFIVFNQRERETPPLQSWERESGREWKKSDFMKGKWMPWEGDPKSPCWDDKMSLCDKALPAFPFAISDYFLIKKKPKQTSAQGTPFQLLSMTALSQLINERFYFNSFLKILSFSKKTAWPAWHCWRTKVEFPFLSHFSPQAEIWAHVRILQIFRNGVVKEQNRSSEREAFPVPWVIQMGQPQTS